MTNGQIAQVQELSKCWIPRRPRVYARDRLFIAWFVEMVKYASSGKIGKREKATLNRLTHQYRHQIKTMKRNTERN